MKWDKVVIISNYDDDDDDDDIIPINICLNLLPQFQYCLLSLKKTEITQWTWGLENSGQIKGSIFFMLTINLELEFATIMLATNLVSFKNGLTNLWQPCQSMANSLDGSVIASEDHQPEDYQTAGLDRPRVWSSKVYIAYVLMLFKYLYPASHIITP